MRDLPEKVYIDRGLRGGLMFRDTRMPDTIAVYVPEDRIAQLERDLVEARVSLGNIGQEFRNASALAELSAEKALTDRFAAFLGKILVGPAFAREVEELEDMYRKARKL